MASGALLRTMRPVRCCARSRTALLTKIANGVLDKTGSVDRTGRDRTAGSEQITPVQLGKGTGLFHHQNLHPQLEQCVKRRHLKVFGPRPVQRRDHDAPADSPAEALSPSALVPQDHTSSNSAGSPESVAPNDGTMSFKVGSHA